MITARIRTLGLIFITGLVLVWARVVHLQLGLGPWHRATMVEGEFITRLIRAPRGTIRSSDGTILAQDRCDAELTVHYRYLERPTNEEWLERQARARLSRKARRDPVQVHQAKQEFRQEVEAMWQALVELTGTPESEFDRRAMLVQRRVERIVESVNRRRRERWERDRAAHNPSATISNSQGNSEHAHSLAHSASTSLVRRFCAWLANETSEATRDSPPQPIAVLEQDQYFTLAPNISAHVLFEFTSAPERFPGVQLKQRIRRVYPQNELACALVGYTEPQEDGDGTFATLNSGQGRAGIEGYYDVQLCGVPGHVRELTGPGKPARVLGGRPPQSGHDVTLTVNLRLQRTAEELLQRSTHTVTGAPEQVQRATSGSVVVLDVRTGAVLAGASAPRFDLNTAAQPASDEARELMNRVDSPLFNRLVQMSLPPGSVFKPVTAVAAIEGGVDPHETFHCRGFLRTPDRLRCLIYRNFGIGHEAVGLHDALIRSCNVYFFHVAERLGSDSIVRWGEAFGFGRQSGIDLFGEEAGILSGRSVPSSSMVRGPYHNEPHGIAIGQDRFLATPVQVAVMMAAIANGGLRVVPHVRRDAFQPPTPIPGIFEPGDRTLAEVRRALEQVVSDGAGTGHEHVYLPDIEIAGKTGTAQSGSPLGDHAWFAGYVPAAQPAFAIVVVLEHAGSGGPAAGPLARDLVRHMVQDRIINAVPPAPKSASNDSPRR